MAGQHRLPGDWPKMINSRDIMDLLPTVRQMCAQFLEDCRRDGIDVILTATFRDHAAQAALYAQGRTAPGRIVTNAAPGWSWHQWRCAFDIVPMRNGKPVWGTVGDDLALWMRCGAIGENIGLEWAGRWTSFREFPHFQHTYGRTIADVNEKGATLPEGLDGSVYTIQTGSVPTRMMTYIAAVSGRVRAYLTNGKGP